MSAPRDFDRYAQGYDLTLDQALEVTGEHKDYFASGRVAFLKQSLDALGICARSVLDYGCGIGSATPHLLETLGADRVVGVDVSAESIAVAKQAWGSRAAFSVLEAEPPDPVDLVFCNGVFHHIPLAGRAGAVQYVHRSLKPGGVFALWENNPWNPGANLVMRRCEFDRDAIKIAPPGARRLLRTGGFEILSTRFLFIFPSPLRALRPIEPSLARLPLGGQYQVLARKVS